MRINLIPKEKWTKLLYQAVLRIMPLHWRDEARKIMKNLVKHDIIEPVDYPTAWWQNH